jgi:DNA-binding Lrp family transcriptional regulator
MLCIVHLGLPLKSFSHRQRFLESLASLEEACAVAELGGEGHFEVRLLVRGRDHLDELLQALAARLPFSFRMHTCSVVLETDYSGTSDRELPTSMISSLHFGPLPVRTRPYELDQKDHEVLSALSNLSYLNLQTVARFLSMPPATLQYRVERLEKAGVIKGHYYVMDPKLFNETPICLQVKARVLTKKEKSTLQAFCRVHPRIAVISFLLGDHGFEVYTLVREQKQAYQVIADLSAKFGDAIESIHMTPQISFAKYSLYPFKNLATLGFSV